MTAELQPKPNAPDDPDKAELACRVVNVAWGIIAGRLPWRSHIDRIRDLEDAGLVADEINFPRMAAGVR